MKFCHLPGAQEKIPDSPVFTHWRSKITKCRKGEKEEDRRKSWNTRKWEISLSGTPHASSKISQTTIITFYNKLVSRTQNLLFEKFRSTAVGLVSSRNNFVCKEKEIRNLPQINLESDWRTQKKKYLEERTPSVTQNKNWRQNKKPLFYTPPVQLVFCPTKLLSTLS